MASSPRWIGSAVVVCVALVAVDFFRADSGSTWSDLHTFRHDLRFLLIGLMLLIVVAVMVVRRDKR